MRGAFLVIVVVSLLVVGYLVVREMDTRRAVDENGQIEEIERARQVAGQAKDAVDAIRDTLKHED